MEKGCQGLESETSQLREPLLLKKEWAFLPNYQLYLTNAQLEREQGTAWRGSGVVAGRGGGEKLGTEETGTSQAVDRLNEGPKRDHTKELDGCAHVQARSGSGQVITEESTPGRTPKAFP